MATRAMKEILLGTKLMENMAAGNVEFQRKANILLVLTGIALVMLFIFSSISFLRGEFEGGLMNLFVLLIVATGYFHMRLYGVLTFASYVFTIILSLQFFSDFSTDTNSAMWSYTIPILSFFLLGMRGGAIISIVYLILGLTQMFFLAPDLYPIDFKLRFPAIFLSIAFFTYSYENIRILAQNEMEKAQRRLEEEKEKLAESDRALQDFKALVRGKTITISESK
ncbi:MAG: hypothetical protein MUP22_02625 [Desulfobacterales bacterium]|nr:hypothetical protein [Desulfobacterales bacterium]